MFALTETWLSDFIINGEILPSNYIYRSDCDGRGGGVLLAVHQSLPVSVVATPPSLEVVSLLITYDRSISICVCTVLYSPLSWLDSLQVSTRLSRPPILHLWHSLHPGCPDIIWATLSASSSLLCDFIFQRNLLQLVKCTKGAILDLIITNSAGSVRGLEDKFLFSDHFLIRFQLSFDKPCPSSYSRPRSFSNYSKSDFFRSTTWLLVCCLDEIWSILKSAISEAVSHFTPSVTSRTRTDPKWFRRVTKLIDSTLSGDIFIAQPGTLVWGLTSRSKIF